MTVRRFQCRLLITAKDLVNCFNYCESTMYELPRTPPAAPNQIPAISAAQYALPLSLRNRRRTDRTSPFFPTSNIQPRRKKRNSDYREILKNLKKTCQKLKLHEHGLHISLLELPEGFELKAYDCRSNRQICRQLNERFFYSSEKIELLIKEIMSGTGLIIDLSG